MALDAQIEQLSDQQALSIVASLTAELGGDDLPEDSAGQAEALEVILAERGEPVGVQNAEDSSPEQAAPAARELLAVMGEIPEIRPSLEEWLADPPSQEAAALPLLLAAPIVITGCIVLLQIVGHTSFRRSAEGRWEVSYDPAREAPIDDVIKKMGDPLAKLAGAAGGGGS